MLTQQQIDEMDKVTGLTGTTAQSSRISELRGLSNNPEVKTPEKRSFAEKVAGFTGGEKIAQGLGQAIANPQIAKEREQALNDAIKQQSELLKKKKEIQELGGDTSHIDKGLEYNQQNLQEISGSMEQLLNQKGLTTKQVVGDALQLGTTIVGVGTLPGASKGVTAAKTFAEGAKQGAILGAKSGAIYGASSGVSSGLKEDKNALDIAKQGVGGALVGAGTGAVLGGLTGGIVGKVKGAKEAKIAKDLAFREQLASPAMNDKLAQEAVMQGRVSEPGFLKGGKIAPGKKEKDLATAIEGVVSSKKSDLQNVEALLSETSKVNERVKSYVRINKSPFNTAQLNKNLNTGKTELDVTFAGDKQATKVYDAVVKEFMKHVENKDTSGLLDARQAFDKVPAISKILNQKTIGENVKKEVVLTVREKANEYVASLLPEGNAYREMLMKESKMLRVAKNLADKITLPGYEGRITQSQLVRLAKKYPMLPYIVGTTILSSGMIGGYAAIKSAD